VSSASFIALSADETSACDNTSWIAIHVYVVENWCRVPHLLTIQKMESDGATANRLTSVITAALSFEGGVSEVMIPEKLLCFGADGVTTFQGLKSGVTTQIKENYAPFTTGVHCCAHRLNLAAQSLSSMLVMHSIEDVLRMTHAYFAHSPKKAAEFKALAQQLESRGLKLLKNVKTRWISCLAPIRRLLAEYKGVIAMMIADKKDRKWGQKARVSPTIFFLHSFLVSLFPSVTSCAFQMLNACSCFVFVYAFTCVDLAFSCFVFVYASPALIELYCAGFQLRQMRSPLAFSCGDWASILSVELSKL